MAKPPRTQTRIAERPVRSPVSPVAPPVGRITPTTPAPLRPTYPDAVALYQQGLELIGARRFEAAADALRSVLSLYPEQKQLLERVRLYLTVCERQASPPPAVTPRTREERLCAATLAINAGRLEDALALLRAIQNEDPDHDGALYMLAVVHAQRREHAEALGFLARAVALNGENRALALHEPDLEELLQDPAARSLLQPAATPSDGHRPSPIRPRAGR